MKGNPPGFLSWTILPARWRSSVGPARPTLRALSKGILKPQPKGWRAQQWGSAGGSLRTRVFFGPFFVAWTKKVRIFLTRKRPSHLIDTLTTSSLQTPSSPDQKSQGGE